MLGLLADMRGQPSSAAEPPSWDPGDAAGAIESGGQESGVVAKEPKGGKLCPEPLPLELPDPTIAMPSDILPEIVSLTATFHLRCEVDLKKVAFSVRNAEYNPRKHSSLTLRLLDPRVTALIREKGVVSVSGKTTPELIKTSAKKVARIIQKVGYEEAKFDNFQICNILAKADLRFPVRLESLAMKWRRNALYEPEIYCGCVFKLSNPRCTLNVTSGGKCTITGCKNMEDAKEALVKCYSVFHEFQR
eukprot:gnl/TRDRNA2_/TRDRNA2_204878_c0_seq1.p1 gnl/TRDRNA2_/TRDRNA2_204878_c0~~gnl/TRDRNA2_/TRDRNA2_204878_c0_seq1.p1  ORF type:complete len:255 (+),score=46.26 gnl/TRDRNA2_/TRDRNA2_204878_c0_seq1:25-765(+)